MASTRAAESALLPGQVTISDEEFRLLRTLVHQQAGIALGDSKRALVCARLGRRLRHYGYATFGQYYEHLMERDPGGAELLRMINAITTNKTDFFREPHHFDFLRSEVLGRLAARTPSDGQRSLRLWSAGCSSGEEPYSMAVTVLDGLPRAFAWDVRILASDIDTDMLERGRTAVYPADQLTQVPEQLRRRYFLRGRGASEGWVRVRPDVQQLVSFRRINLRDEAWPIRTLFDAVFCRNVIIYFDRQLQQRLVGQFLQFLKPGGYLFLGHSESLLGMRVGLRYLGGTVYQKVDVPGNQGENRG
jgi:chemotaxis protein methyltransferase CheR